MRLRSEEMDASSTSARASETQQVLCRSILRLSRKLPAWQAMTRGIKKAQEKARGSTRERKRSRAYKARGGIKRGFRTGQGALGSMNGDLARSGQQYEDAAGVREASTDAHSR